MNRFYITQSIFSMKHIWQVLLFFIVFCSAQKAEGQIEKIGTFKDTIAAIQLHNDTLYAVLHAKTYLSNYTDTLKILAWDGISWATKASLPYMRKNVFTSNMKVPVQSLHMLKGDFYINGFMDSLPGLHGQSRLIKWDGSKWSVITSLPYNFSYYSWYLKTVIYDEKLFVHSEPNNQNFNIAYYDGTGWTAASTNSTNAYANYTKFEKLGNKLYLTGYFNGNYASPPLEWDGNGWIAAKDASLSAGIIQHGWYLFSFDHHKNGYIHYRKNAYFNDKRYADSVEYWDGQKMHLLNNGFINEYTYGFTKNIISYNNRLYRIGTFIKNNITSLVLVWDSTAWVPLNIDFSNIIGQKMMSHGVASANQLVLAGGGSKLPDSTYVFRLNNVVKISGKVYHDFNSDCIADNSERKKENVFVQLLPDGTYVNTNAEGEFTFYTGPGKYDIKALPKKYWKQSCPDNDSAISVNAQTDTVYDNNNFAVAPKYSAQDIRVTLTGSTGWRARQGFTENYTLCYENVGTTKAAGLLHLKIDSAFTNFTSNPAAKNYTFPFAEWEFDSLEIGEKRCITFQARLDSATLNDSVMLIAAFDGGDSWIDSSMNDNIDTLKQRVVAAVDPNDKTSFPEGDITKETKELRYQIRFQNTGTDTAYRVTIIDTVDTNLPLTKVMMNSASHKYKLDIKNNVFKWIFDGILLPDSNTNEPLSHGFINYTAQIKPGLAIGTEIRNTAYIYFDYQKPVITNTALSKMTEPVGIRKERTQSISSQLHIYPNPASNYLYIKNEGNEAKEIHLVNILGKVLKTIKVQPFELHKLPLEYLKNGIYFIRSNGESMQKLIIQH